MPYSECVQERVFLQSVVNRLEELNLITSEDKLILDLPCSTQLEIKARMYDLLIKKDYTTGIQILKIMKEVENSEGSLEDAVEDRKNPLLHNPVIKCLFGFLSVEDIKNCRLVSWDWSSIGMTILMDRTSIVISADPSSDRLLENFYSCFPIPDARLSAFEITSAGKGLTSHPWSNQKLTEFFEGQQEYIKDLKLNRFKFVTDDIENEEIAKNFDVTPWVFKSPIVKQNHEYLTKLEAGCKNLIIPLHVVAHVQELYLAFCFVDVSIGIQIYPVKLQFALVTFRNNGINLPNIKIKDFINFSRIKELSLESEFRKSDKTEMILDLKGNASLERLNLEFVTTINWGASKWLIDDMNMYGAKFTLKSEMKITELQIAIDTIDLCVIPQSVEKLTIFLMCDTATIICDQPVQLHRLKYLGVTSCFGFSLLSHFNDCPLLTQLYLEDSSRSRNLFAIKSPLIPKKVKILSMRDMSINLDDSDHLNLERLIIGYVDYRFVRKLFPVKALPKDLVIEVNCHHMSGCDTFEFSWEFQQLCTFGHKRLYIGLFTWSDDAPFEKSPLCDRVDKESSCYVFENQKGIKGRAISDEDFVNMADCS